jgi:lysophospholipase L1-like esterase
VRAKLPNTKILLLAIFPRSAKASDGIRQRVVATNKLLAPIADDKTVFFMDISGKFLDAEGNLSPDIMPDYLHPNAKGYQIWLDAVKPKLDELMK